MAQVRQRTVFYLSGFDPKGAAHYHALYRDHAARQAAVSGLHIEVGPRRRGANGHGVWSLHASPDGVETHFECLRWDDLVRQHWPQGNARLWWAVLRSTTFNLRHGVLWRLFRHSWPPALALFLPFLLVLAQLLGVPLLALGTAWLAGQAGAPLWLAGLCGATAAGMAWWATRRLEARYALHWMMRSYAFTRRQALGQLPELEQRLDQQAARLVARWREGVDDEILLVGHSTGAVMAVAVLARACALAPDLGQGGAGPRVALLTLGQWIPALGLLPQAEGFRHELARLSQTRLDWIDFSAPPDGCCCALTDPYGLCGVPSARADFPKLLNPRFADMFDAAAYQALKRDKLQLHFQYLMAAQRPSAYDYFAITAGDRFLADRFADQAPVRNYQGLRPCRARG